MPIKWHFIKETMRFCKRGQTFIIDRNNAIFESFFNPELMEDIRAGRFIHAGGMLVINDPKYVQKYEGCEATLTDYALEHADECCLVFDRITRVSTHYDDSFYRICFLCRDADSKSFVEAKFNPREEKTKMLSNGREKWLLFLRKQNEYLKSWVRFLLHFPVRLIIISIAGVTLTRKWKNALV